jgi:hypothetical protein
MNTPTNQKAARAKSLEDINGPQLCRAASKGHLEKVRRENTWYFLLIFVFGVFPTDQGSA